MDVRADGRRWQRIVGARDELRRIGDDDQQQEDWHARRRRLRALALNETSAAFTASAPSETAVFSVMASRMAKQLSAGCLIRPDPGVPGRVSMAAGHVRPQARLPLRALMRSSPDALGSAYCAWVSQCGRSILTSEVSSRSLRLWTGQAAWPYLEECDICSFLVVPIGSADRVLGTLTLWRERPGQPLDDDDRFFAEEVGRRLVPR